MLCGDAGYTGVPETGTSHKETQVVVWSIAVRPGKLKTLSKTQLMRKAYADRAAKAITRARFGTVPVIKCQFGLPSAVTSWPKILPSCIRCLPWLNLWMARKTVVECG